LEHSSVSTRPARLALSAALLFAAGCSTARAHESPQGAYKQVGPVTVTVSGDVLAVARSAHVELERPLFDTIRRVDGALRLPSTSVDVVVAADRVIPEFGVAGFTSANGRVTISIAPKSPVGLRAALTTWLDLTAAHELNHATRILSGPGIGLSLRGAMISEGLADRFAASILPSAPVPPWDRALTPAQEHVAWAHAESVLDSVNRSDIDNWLFGGSGIARWTAYTLGADIVTGARRRAPQQSWADLTRADASTILGSSDFHP
jgi:uncharacterized protein YjaZ